MTALAEGNPTLEIEAQGRELITTAGGFEIVTAADYAEAAGFLRGLKAYRDRVAEAFDSTVAAAHKAWKEATATRSRYEAPAAEAERIVKAKMGTYQAAAEKKRREEETRLRLEAAKRAEEERSRKALEALAEGNAAKAVETLLRPPAPVAVVVPRATPKVEGVSSRIEYRFRIVDAAALPREYLVPDEKKIAAEVRAKKGETKIAGVEVYEETIIAARAGR